MKYEEYRQRLNEEQIAAARSDLSQTTYSPSIEQFPTQQMLIELTQRLKDAEECFYRRRWWQVWRPPKPR